MEILLKLAFEKIILLLREICELVKMILTGSKIKILYFITKITWALKPFVYEKSSNRQIRKEISTVNRGSRYQMN